MSLLEIFSCSSVVFRSFGGLKMFGEKSFGKCTMFIGIAVMPRLCCPVFYFDQFKTNATNTFDKNYPNSELQVSER